MPALVGVAQQIVDDGDQVGEAFARACAAGDHIAAPVRCQSQRAFLMGVQAQRLARARAENPPRVGMQHALLHQRIERHAVLVGGAKLQHRRGPQGALVPNHLLRIRTHPRVCNLHEGMHKLLILLHHPLMQREQTHGQPPTRLYQ
jgi:hypothetical protein